MVKETKFAAEKKHGENLACNRGLAEQIEDIRRYGNHGASPILRAAVLAAHGIAKPKETAENGILFGCYRPFTTPFLLRDYTKLLDMLGVDYTCFEKEYCCGLPLTMLSGGKNQENTKALGVEFNRLNLGLARQKRVKTLAYCCVGCAYVAKSSAGDAPERQIYILDLILDKLDQKPPRVAPTVIGYFEGCHTFYKTHFPEVSLGWKRYRQFLGGIEGLEVVDLPNGLCCKTSASRIIENAEKHKLEKVICSCNGCYVSLREAGKGKLKAMNMPEFLLQVLEEH